MKKYFKQFMAWLILVSLLTACSTQKMNERISFDDLFISMIGNDYKFNQGFKGAEEISKIFPGEERRILDYLMVESVDVLSNELFIFLEIEPTYKQDAKSLVEQYLKSWGMNLSIEEGFYSEDVLLFESDTILIYVISEESEKLKPIIIEAFE